MDLKDLALKLEQVLIDHGGYLKPLEVSGLKLLTGGASAQTWLFEISSNTKNETHKQTQKETLILRRNATEDQFPGAVGKVLEAKVQQAAGDAGVPIAQVKAVLPESAGLGAGYVMAYVAGESIPQKLLKQAQYAKALEAMTQQCGEILAKLHSIPITEFPDLVSYSIEQQIITLKQEFLSYQISLPIFTLAFRWLLENMPALPHAALVHGDFRNGNFIVGEAGIKAVVDWELTHLGDPIEDLGWICVNSWRFGRRELPVGGFGLREDLCAAYERAGGSPVDPKHLKYWELYGTLRWGVICLHQASVYLNGQSQSIERAAIGRRVSETEIDIMMLLKELT